MTVRLLRPFNGLQTNAIVELDRATEASLVQTLGATTNLAIGTQFVPNEVFSYNTFGDGFTQLVSGQWVGLPAMFRLRLMGSGSIVLDAMNRFGNVTTGVQTYTASNATNQIEFPYLGDDAVMFCATFPVTLAAEVLK